MVDNARAIPSNTVNPNAVTKSFRVISPIKLRICVILIFFFYVF